MMCKQILTVFRYSHFQLVLWTYTPYLVYKIFTLEWLNRIDLVQGGKYIWEIYVKASAKTAVSSSPILFLNFVTYR